MTTRNATAECRGECWSGGVLAACATLVEPENITCVHQNGSRVAKVLGTSPHDTLLAPARRGRWVTATSATARLRWRARVSISVFTKKFVEFGKICCS